MRQNHVIFGLGLLALCHGGLYASGEVAHQASSVPTVGEAAHYIKGYEHGHKDGATGGVGYVAAVNVNAAESLANPAGQQSLSQSARKRALNKVKQGVNLLSDSAHAAYNKASAAAHTVYDKASDTAHVAYQKGSDAAHAAYAKGKKVGQSLWKDLKGVIHDIKDEF